MKMRIAGIVSDSIVDGPGIRYTIFAQGCPRDCPGCHNPQTHDPQGGYEIDVAKLVDEIRANPLLDGVTFSGGEPLMQAAPLTQVARVAKELGLNVVVYSGYSWEEICAANNANWNELLEFVDVLVDGPYESERRDWNLRFAGSTNQRFIDVQRTLRSDALVVLPIFDHMPTPLN